MGGCDLYAPAPLCFISDVQVLDCSCGFQWMGCGLLVEIFYCYCVMLD